jgi:hypothetical protein
VLHLFGRVTQCVERAFVVELVTSDELQSSMSIFFQLAGRAKLCHHVHGIVRGTMVASPGRCPKFPARRTKPAHLQAAITSGRAPAGFRSRIRAWLAAR